MSSYSPEQKAEMMARAREALEGADQTLAKPRTDAPWPPVETRSQRWDREAREREQQFAAERAALRPLTDWEAAQSQRDELAGMIAEQKELFLGVLAEIVAHLRSESDLWLETYADELGKLLGDLVAEELGAAERRIAKAYKSESGGGEVIDLPKFPLTRKRT
jgi:hypothetical protein